MAYIHNIKFSNIKVHVYLKTRGYSAILSKSRQLNNSCTQV